MTHQSTYTLVAVMALLALALLAAAMSTAGERSMAVLSLGLLVLVSSKTLFAYSSWGWVGCQRRRRGKGWALYAMRGTRWARRGTSMRVRVGGEGRLSGVREISTGVRACTRPSPSSSPFLPWRMNGGVPCHFVRRVVVSPYILMVLTLEAVSRCAFTGFCGSGLPREDRPVEKGGTHGRGVKVLGVFLTEIYQT